ncbi:dol-P-Glc:Glc(2)Man(9)GlcNAc(2)-PP-Dol alpha-1,2-glucosyltransferase [Diabrotica undecimpunctata]|uniref:dol-P-Glc:Glc(2)Man(9)GlcNAc(2)-PP-Dol alpha-1,2-glucosyltransferase n=1 Tax=Diabrotica undecimpunctata TaxID=50387 RepID=UPI003B633813
MLFHKMCLNKLKFSHMFFINSVIVFFAVSVTIFNYIYLTSNMIIDEEFHLPLGKLYCNFDFFVWDPKVTTLPGLYIVSSMIMGPLSLCTTYWLRFVSLVFSIINILLFYFLFDIYDKHEWGNIFSSLTLALLPPLYFFSHVYYTDVVSLTMVLLMMVASEKKCHYMGAIFGMAAIICRQTNIIWLILISGKYALTEIYNCCSDKETSRRGIPAIEFITFLTEIIKNPLNKLHKMTTTFWCNAMWYIAIMLIFLGFLIYNGGIVVGDKTAHVSTIHIPQLFYFSLFCLIFSWPHFVGEVSSFLAFTRKHKISIFAVTLLGFLIVMFNTQVHPYLLADNRHYMFYIWNRFYQKYVLFKYVIVPVYIFAWYVIIKLLYDKDDITFLFFYLVCTTIVLVTQKLIEVRYFLIPYILFRLRLKSNANNAFNLVLEFVTYLLINRLTLQLFFTKVITWNDYSEFQRIIW